MRGGFKSNLMKFKIFTQEDKAAVKEYIDELPDGKPFSVVIVRWQSKRTMDQNRLYWLWLNCIAKDGELGYTAEELHCVFAQKFLGARQKIMYGESALVDVPSTRRLDTKEFSAYLEKIETFANTELGIPLPNPQDKYFNQFYEQYKDVI